jgi:hypothetical protein
MTTAQDYFNADLARLANDGWRIHDQPGLWWARCPECLGLVEAPNFACLDAVATAHMAKHGA